MTVRVLFFGAFLALSLSTTFGTTFAPGSPVSGEFVLGPTSPGKWGTPAFGTPGGLVTYSYTPTGTSCAAEGTGCTITALADFMPLGFTTAIDAAFSAWSSIADITFSLVADNGLAFNAGGATGDIRLGGHAFDGPSGTLAHGFFPPVNGTSAAGDIHFDTAEAWSLGVGPGLFDIFLVAAHEIGHAIGLDHTGVPNSLMNPFYNAALTGLQADDIAGAQFIYGPSAIPEPSTMLLAGFGTALLIGLKLRRRA